MVFLEIFDICSEDLGVLLNILETHVNEFIAFLRTLGTFLDTFSLSSTHRRQGTGEGAGRWCGDTVAPAAGGGW